MIILFPFADQKYFKILNDLTSLKFYKKLVEKGLLLRHSLLVMSWLI